MILINLLPHREAARKRRREAFYVSLGMSALAGGIISGVIYGWYAAQISNQQNRNVVLQNELKRLDSQIKDIASLQDEIAALKARQQAVEDLQADRNLPVHLLNELVRLLPEGVYIVNLTQEGQTVKLSGMAQSNERVSELLRNLSNGSPWLTKPELVVIRAETAAVSAKDSRRVSRFEMRVRLLRASEAAKAASAAGSGTPAPQAAASAAPAVTAAPAAPAASQVAAAKASAPVAQRTP